MRFKMPLYDFFCDKCGVTIEVFRHFSDNDLKPPDCCNALTRQLFSAVAFRMEGSTIASAVKHGNEEKGISDTDTPADFKYADLNGSSEISE